MHEVEVLRVSLVFGRAHGDLTLSGGGAMATRGVGGGVRAAASTVVMRLGCHYAQFTVVIGARFTVTQCQAFFGVIRPGWDVEGRANAHDVDGHCCFYFTGSGRRWPGHRTWEGRQGATQGDHIGMLLDLEQGSMTVWKDDVKLGVMQSEGLSGPLCWLSRCLKAPARASSRRRRPRHRQRRSWRRWTHGRQHTDKSMGVVCEIEPLPLCSHYRTLAHNTSLCRTRRRAGFP